MWYEAIPYFMAAAGVPSALVGFCFWLLQRSLTRRAEAEDEERKKRQQETDEREHKREQLQLVIINSVNASIALSEATARAVQRIPDAKCNGDMHAALDYAAKVKHEQKNFLTTQGVQHIIQ